MQAIESKAIKAIGYDDRLLILRITFHSGQSFEYLDVPPEEFTKFMNAESRGAYVNQVIKRKYECGSV
jgi:hypothetical protein